VSEFSDLKDAIVDWANRADWSDALLTSFIRMTERKLNTELRVDRMILSSTGVLDDTRAVILPDDWLKLDLVQLQFANSPGGFVPIRFRERDPFMLCWPSYRYTIEGRTLYIGGSSSGLAYKFDYYAEVPQLDDSTNSWVYEKYQDLYLTGALSFAALHAVGEEESAANFKALTEDTIAKLNAEHLRAKASGSRISKGRSRSFG
jgi:hypothetical protein